MEQNCNLIRNDWNLDQSITSIHYDAILVINHDPESQH